MTTRRVFLQGAIGASFFASCAAPQTGPRRRWSLKEPGPILPPVPAILLTVNGAPGEPDEISVLWTFVLNGKPPQVGVSAEKSHRARDLIARHGEFVLNVPTSAIVRQFDKVDMNSSKVGDKFKLSGLTRGKAAKVNAPTVEECPIQVECKVIKDVDLPPIRRVFLAEVVATRVQEGACDESGRLNVPNVDFFGMTSGSGEFYTMGRKVGHIGQSVGIDTIRY